MANKSRFTMDFKAFEKDFSRHTKSTIPNAAAKGGYQAGAKILRYAILEKPTVPKKTGHLRREQRVLEPKISGNEITIYFGFNTPYAAKVHEAPTNWNWSEPGSGPKYLQSAMTRHKEDAIKIIADYIRSKAK